MPGGKISALRERSVRVKIVIPGGSGELGTIIGSAFAESGYEVVILSRSNSSTEEKGITYVQWDGVSPGPWMQQIDGSDLVFNLAGRSVNCRYTDATRQEIMESRVLSTRAVGRAIEIADNPPPLWINMSTATIYAHSYDKGNDEFTGIIGGEEPSAPKSWGFSIKVAKAWEEAVDNAFVPGIVRKVKLRSAVVMTPDPGGPFSIMSKLVRLGLGGKNASGKQMISWISDKDFIKSIFFILNNPQLEDIVNVTSPNPLANADFMRILREAWGKPIGLPAAQWMLSIGAVLLKTETELVLKSRYVLPGKLLQAGFTFDQAQWPEAAADLVERARGSKSH